MADLDDFFAKKDRKKAKGKKFTTTEEIAKKLEETGKKVLDKSKLKEKPRNPEGTDENQQIVEEDEWKVFEEKKKDYSGLKIGNLTVTEVPEPNDLEDSGNSENSSDGESGEAGGKQSGPWKKDTAEKEAEAEPQPQQQPPPPQQQEPPSSDGKKRYRPPQARHLPAMVERPIGRLRSKNVAPDINSEEYFPTLNSKQPINDATGVWGKKKRDEGTFEEVRNRGGSRTYAPDVQSEGPKLSLGNKYGALSQDQS